MFSFWENFALSVVMSLLAGLKIDPSHLPKFKTTLVHILNDICIILQVQPPVVP